MSDLAPRPSPLRPAKQIERRRYQQFQLDEALKIALTDGVKYASECTGVAVSSIYKLLRPAKPIIRKDRVSKPKPESPEKLLLRSPVWAKLKALALYYHANVPNDSLRNAMARASIKMGIDHRLAWRAYKAEKYSTK